MSSNAPAHIRTFGENVPDQDTLERLETLGYIESFSVKDLERELSHIERLMKEEEALFLDIDTKRSSRNILIGKAERAIKKILTEGDMDEVIEIRESIQKLEERNSQTLPEYIQVQDFIETLITEKKKLERLKKGRSIRGVYYRITQVGALYAQGKKFGSPKDLLALNYLGYSYAPEIVTRTVRIVGDTIIPNR